MFNSKFIFNSVLTVFIFRNEISGSSRKRIAELTK